MEKLHAREFRRNKKGEIMSKGKPSKTGGGVGTNGAQIKGKSKYADATGAATLPNIPDGIFDNDKNYDRVETGEYGNTRYTLNGELHRIDGPAVERYYGTKEWYQHDKLHRDDGPAIEDANGDKRWFKNGKEHRADGPAVELADGTKEWLQNGNHHRTDGPAVEFPNGNKLWYQHGERHRIDGPAIERADGTKEWYINGKQVSEKNIRFVNALANDAAAWHVNIERRNSPEINPDGEHYSFTRENGLTVNCYTGTNNEEIFEVKCDSAENVYPRVLEEMDGQWSDGWTENYNGTVYVDVGEDTVAFWHDEDTSTWGYADDDDDWD
jgi:hypothetical protein